MSLDRTSTPPIVERPGWVGARYGYYLAPTPIADWTEGERPAIRIKAHCRNCRYECEARFVVGFKIPQWLRCPKCEVMEFSAHGKFLARDEQTLEDEWAEYRERQATANKLEEEADQRHRERLARSTDAPSESNKRWFLR